MDFSDAFHYFIVRAQRRFVNQNHVGNRKPFLFADFEKFGGRAVVKGNLIRLALDAAADFVLPGNGTAADRKINFVQQNISVTVIGAETHTVGMFGQKSLLFKNHVLFDVKRNGAFLARWRILSRSTAET